MEPEEGQPSGSGGSAAALSAANASAATKPTVLLIIGMAGSGKTTLLQRINSELHRRKQAHYIINLDPAVINIPYAPNIDIRDTVKYKDVMREYNLGPNGGILTACNLFATKFDQVMNLCEKTRTPPLQHIVVDTPGQIEAFTWSASGTIFTDLFASSFPTVVVFVVDTVRSVSPQTFMTNMLQACSILYKTRLPLLLVFNKCDVTKHDFALRWMKDSDEFHAALDSDSSYASTLSRSLSLVLEEFYNNLKAVGVSAVTGMGMDDFFQAVQGCAAEYEQFYKPDLERRKREKLEQEVERQKADLQRLHVDMATDATGPPRPAGDEVMKDEEVDR
eukprot:evm.model.scf_3150.3 EVM.evm.TU.scf_3150.3   scf_3150:9994-14571(+)